MANEKWYVKVWEVIKKVVGTILQFIVAVLHYFFAIFNSWHKLAAIALAVFAWNWLALPFMDKIGTFILFGVLALLVFDIAKEK